MLQSYDFIHKDTGFSEVFVLSFVKSNNMKGNSGELAATQLRVTAIFVNLKQHDIYLSCISKVSLRNNTHYNLLLFV